MARGWATRVESAPAVPILVDVGSPHERRPCELLPLLALDDPRVHAVHLMSDHREPWGGREGREVRRTEAGGVSYGVRVRGVSYGAGARVRRHGSERRVPS